jgi:serine/threonine-protein kinase
MTLQPGSKLGHYEIVSALGAGGMGEVYRAEDTKLGRQVAIKLLLEEVASDPERLARFDRAARLLASLTPPNVATLHGAERDGDTHFLVMELVDGETLADRIARGPLPVDEAIDVFVQIAEGLAAAHERGIIHRDLKPANIKLGEGDPPSVKILDFGLAKAIAPEIETGDPALSNSPTLTMAATMRGEILGTAAYMSPEQAKGKSVDRRADTWAFGVTLYEALTGQRPFRGEDAPTIMARVLDREIDFAPLQGESAGFRRLLARCLEKDPSRRYRDMGDVRLDLEELAGGSGQISDPPRFAPRFREVVAWAAALLLGLTAASTLLSRDPAGPLSVAAPRTVRTTVEAPHLEPEEAYSVTISPDGRTIVYFGRHEGVRQLYRRDLDSLEAQPIEGSQGTWGFQFFSPDGRWIAHMSDSDDLELEKIPIDGGRPIDLVQGLTWSGGDWHEDGTLVVGRTEFKTLHTLPDAGGESTPLTTLAPGEIQHADPHYLPGGKSVIFAVEASRYQYRLAVQRPGDAGHTMLFEGRRPHYLESGHLLYQREDGLWAVPFDPASVTATGEPMPVPDVPYVALAVAAFGASSGGTLVFAAPGTAARGPLVWLDREGKETSLGLPDGAYIHPRLSPDGERVVFVALDQVGGFGRHGHSDLLMLERDSLQPRLLAVPSRVNKAPQWGNDSETLVFEGGSETTGLTSLWVARGGELRDVGLSNPDVIKPGGWLVDGRIVAQMTRSETNGDIVFIDLESGEVEDVLAGPESVNTAELSPDGRWIVYSIDTLDEARISVRSTDPRSSATWDISEGDFPQWVDNDGGELFFLRDDALMSLRMRSDPPFADGDPEVVARGPYFEAPLYFRPYDYDPATDRFLVVRHHTAPRSLVIVQGLHHELGSGANAR